MRVRLRLEGEFQGAVGEVAVGPARALLDAIARTGSLQGAAQLLNVSYRSAWGQVAELERALGRATVVKTKGHGTALTAFGAKLRTALDDAYVGVAPRIAAEQASLGERLDTLFESASGRASGRLSIIASHDPLLLGVVGRTESVKLSVAGSVAALTRLAAGEADAAGFHFGSEDGDPPPPLDRAFRDPALVVRPLFRREQGLILARGNPLALASIADVARKRARFVNRQHGAGTRIWFERLCAEQGVQGDDIVGFHTEEFTHQAVAALIATAAADVGMGTRAAAEAFGLDYLPIGWETYFLAVRTTIDPARVEPFEKAVSLAASASSGYGPPHHIDA